MTRILEHGGTLLIANLTSFNTAGQPAGWSADADGQPRFCIDHYMDERVEWVRWRGMSDILCKRPL